MPVKAHPELHQLAGFLVGQRLQDDRVDHAEDSRCGADPQGQREHRDHRETGTAAEAAQRITDILEDEIHGY